MHYRPNQNVLKKYADVLVNFAFRNGRGMKKGDVVYVVAYEYAKPLYAEILNAVTKAGGHSISQYLPNEDREFNIPRDFYVNAKQHQIDFFPGKYLRGLIDQVDQYLFILSETDMEALKGIDPKKIMRRGEAMKPFRDWRDEKENRGKFDWTLALYGTQAMAKEAGLSEKEYWGQIVRACFLDNSHPIEKWRGVDKKVRAYVKRINGLKIEKLHVSGPDADLWMSLGRKRLWDGGGGRNIPSFEIFTSPDWRGTEGWIRFNNPVYADGQIISGVSLKFRRGVVTEVRAKKNRALLLQKTKIPGGNKVGEFSLTDRRFSNINKFMAETLYDENLGGPNGNTHIAIGRSFHGCYAGDPNKLKKRDWDRLGFNDSSVHQDIVSTSPRRVVAHLKNGREKLIYEGGEFVF
ncbi:MAG: aminopeptidase [Minisyncoccia bacterium]|jgi:aminopeptidase